MWFDTGIALAGTAWQGIVFGVLTLPVCVWAAYTDLSEMRIRNEAVLGLFAIFVVFGPFVLALDLYLWRYLQVGLVLGAGFALASIRALGAGDAKFAAAMAAFVAPGDVVPFAILFSVLLLSTFAMHRVVRRIAPLRALAPGWKSWTASKKFPMGIALASTQVVYLWLAAMQ